MNYIVFYLLMKVYVLFTLLHFTVLLFTFPNTLDNKTGSDKQFDAPVIYVNQKLSKLCLQCYKSSHLCETHKPLKYIFVSAAEVRLHFEIISGDEGGLFSIEPTTGLLSLIGSLDYETTPKVLFANHPFFFIKYLFHKSLERTLSLYLFYIFQNLLNIS